MQISNELADLLKWAVPRMTESGEKLFKNSLEMALAKMVNDSFSQEEIKAFSVKKMMDWY